MIALLNLAIRYLAFSLFVLFSGAIAAQQTQTYPSKPIRLIIPTAPGSASTQLGTLLGQKIAESWRQQVILDHRDGANSIIATEVLARSPADGYTILLANMSHIINPLAVPNLPYDIFKDFVPVSTLTISRFVLAINPSIPANTLQAFIAYAKARPGQLNYASSGKGSAVHLATETLSSIVGIKMEHIPYKGGAPALTGLISNQVQMYMATTISTLPHINAGRIRPLAISGDTRASILPQVPTFAEAGVSGFDVKNWYGIIAPAEVPKPIVEKLTKEIQNVLSQPDIIAKLAGQGVDPYVITPDQFTSMMKVDMEKFSKVIKTANITFD